MNNQGATALAGLMTKTGYRTPDEKRKEKRKSRSKSGKPAVPQMKMSMQPLAQASGQEIEAARQMVLDAAKAERNSDAPRSVPVAVLSGDDGRSRRDKSKSKGPVPKVAGGAAPNGSSAQQASGAGGPECAIKCPPLRQFGVSAKMMMVLGAWLYETGKANAYVQPTSGFAYASGPYNPITVSSDVGLANITTGACKGASVYVLNGTAMPEKEASYVCFPIGMDCLRRFDTSLCLPKAPTAGRNVTYTRMGKVAAARGLQQSALPGTPVCNAAFEGYRQDRNIIVLNMLASSTVPDGCFVSIEGGFGNVTLKSGMNFPTYTTKGRGSRETIQITFCTPSQCSGYSVSVWVADYCPVAPSCWMCMEAVDQYSCANPASKGWIDATKAALVLTILSSIMYILSPIIRAIGGYFTLLASCRSCVEGCCSRRQERRLPVTNPEKQDANKTAADASKKRKPKLNLDRVRAIAAMMYSAKGARALDAQEISRMSSTMWQLPLTNAGILVQDQGTCVPNNKGTMVCTLGVSGLGHYDGTPNTCREWVLDKVNYGGASIDSEATVVRLCAVYYSEVYSLTFAAGVPDYGATSRGHVWCNVCGDARARPADAFCWTGGCQTQTTGFCWGSGSCNKDLVYGFGAVPRSNEWLNVHDLGIRTASEIVFMAQSATRGTESLKLTSDVQVLGSGSTAKLSIEGSEVFTIELSASNALADVSLPPGLRVLDYPAYFDETYIGSAGSGGITGTWPEVVTTYKTYDEWSATAAKQAVCPPAMVRGWSANCDGGWGAETVFTKVEDIWNAWKYINEPSIAGAGVTLTSADRLAGARTLLNVRVTRSSWPQVSVSIRATGVKVMTTANSLPCPVISKVTLTPASLGTGTGGNVVLTLASTCGAGVSVVSGWGAAGRATTACSIPSTGTASCTLVVPLSSPDEEFDISASGRNGAASTKVRIPASFEGVIQINSTSVTTVAATSGSNVWKSFVDGLRIAGEGAAMVFNAMAKPILGVLGLVSGDSSVNTWLSYLIIAAGVCAAALGIWYGVTMAQKLGYCKCKKFRNKKAP